MNSLALVTLVVCGLIGVATLVVGWRWLLRVGSDSARAGSAARPRLPASSGTAAAPTVAPVVPARAPQRPLPVAREVIADPLAMATTQPITHSAFGPTEWAPTQPAPSAYVDTQPMR